MVASLTVGDWGYKPGWMGVRGWLNFWRVVFCTGISQRPSVGFRIPSKITSSSLTAKSDVLLRYTSQLSSHNCPMEIREALLSPGRIIADDARLVKDEDNGRLPDDVEEMDSPLGRRTDGPTIGRIFESTEVSSSRQ